MTMRVLRGSLVASVALLPAQAWAQAAATLDEINVVATTPAGASGTGGRRPAPVAQPAPAQAAPAPGSVAAAPASAPLPAPAPAAERLRGGAQPLYKIPSTVESVTASDARNLPAVTTTRHDNAA